MAGSSKTPCEQPWAIAVGSVGEDTGERLVAARRLANEKPAESSENPTILQLCATSSGNSLQRFGDVT